MTDSVAITLSHVIAINDVTNIVVTEAVSDGEGGYTRAIRIFGEPNKDIGPAIVELKVTGSTKENIQLTTPALEF